MPTNYLSVSWNQYHALSQKLADATLTIGRGSLSKGEIKVTKKPGKSIALFYKPRSAYKPDYVAETTKQWILFPHEVTEWIYAFTQKGDPCLSCETGVY